MVSVVDHDRDALRFLWVTDVDQVATEIADFRLPSGCQLAPSYSMPTT